MGNRSKGRSNDYVYNEFYAKHRGQRSNDNPVQGRSALIERMYWRILTELATNRFKWTGLPENIDVRFLEMELFQRALAVFFFEERFDKFMVMAGTPSGNWNMNMNPTSFFVNGPTYAGRTLKAFNTTRMGRNNSIDTDLAECVPIWSNYMRTPDLDIVSIFANRFAELDTTIEINSRSARRNKIIVVDENNRLTGRNINAAIDNGDAVLEVNEVGLAAMPIALDLGVDPLSLEKLHILKSRQWNECLTLMGIDNANQDKKERLVASEVDANDGGIMANRAISLNARQQAADAINKRYGLNVEVMFDEEISGQLNGMLAGPFSDPAMKAQLSDYAATN